MHSTRKSQLSHKNSDRKHVPAIEPISITIGRRIVSLRKQKGLTQAELATLCKKHPQSIERVENGKINPSVGFLHAIAKGLEVPLSALIE